MIKYTKQFHKIYKRLENDDAIITRMTKNESGVFKDREFASMINEKYQYLEETADIQLKLLVDSYVQTFDATNSFEGCKCYKSHLMFTDSSLPERVICSANMSQISLSGESQSVNNVPIELYEDISESESDVEMTTEGENCTPQIGISSIDTNKFLDEIKDFCNSPLL